MARLLAPSALIIAEAEWEAAQEERRQRAIQEEQTAAEMAARQQARSQDVWRIYRNDPVAWVHDMIDWRDGEGPAPYQDEILAEIPRRKRVAAYGPHGLGKTAMEAWLTLWYALTRDGEDWKIPTTASVWRQLRVYLWPEIRKWARRLRWDKLGRDPFTPRTELLQLSLKLTTGEAFAVASDVPENMEGAHADRLLGLFDESKTIPDETFDAFEGAFSGPGEVLVVAMSTPGAPIGRFYKICSRAPGTEDWYVRHVTKDEVIRAGRMSSEWAAQRAKLWGGEQSAIYQNRVEGNFAAGDEDSVIPLAWVEAAHERWHQAMAEIAAGAVLPPFTAVGTDVGSGSAKADKTVHALRHDWIVPELRVYQHEDTMQTAGRIKGITDAHGGYAVVDVIGIGSGVVDRLREQGVNVHGFVAGAASKKRDRSGELGFADRRSEAWWGIRERLDPSTGDDIALPPDDMLTGDLTAPKSRILSGGRIKVESKDDLRKPDRLGRSTDYGDAVVQVFWEPDDRETELAAPVGIERNTPGWS